MKLYALHQSHEHSNGSSSAVLRQLYKTEDEAILANKKEYRDYYDIAMVYVLDKKLNLLQAFVKKLFRI